MHDFKVECHQLRDATQLLQKRLKEIEEDPAIDQWKQQVQELAAEVRHVEADKHQEVSALQAQILELKRASTHFEYSRARQLSGITEMHSSKSRDAELKLKQRDAVISQKNQQIEELTGVLRRQTEHLRKYRLGSQNNNAAHNTVESRFTRSPAVTPRLSETSAANTAMSTPRGSSGHGLANLLQGTGFEHHSQWLASFSRRAGSSQFIVNGDFMRLTNLTLGANVWYVIAP